MTLQALSAREASIFACLTDAGYTRLRGATPTHLRGVASYVIDRVSADQLAAWGEACAQIAAPEGSVTPGPKEATSIFSGKSLSPVTPARSSTRPITPNLSTIAFICSAVEPVSGSFHLMRAENAANAKRLAALEAREKERDARLTRLEISQPPTQAVSNTIAQASSEQ